MTNDVIAELEKYMQTGMSTPPTPLAPAPVHTGGVSTTDANAAAFGAATNADIAGTNTDIAGDHADRTGHALDAVRKFSEHEADAASQFEKLAGKGDAALAGKGPQDAMGGAMQGITGALQGVTGALSGVLGSVGKVPQGLMQAGQGALSPLMSLAKGGLGGATLASNVHPDLGGSAGTSGTGGSGGGLGMGTTPASNLGPPPVPGTSTPTTPASAMAKGGMAGAPAGVSGPGGGGGGMMPMMPGGAGGGGKGGKDGPTESKRIAAPGMPNGQPVKGRTTASPNVPVTKSATKDASHPGITPLKRIVDKKDSSK